MHNIKRKCKCGGDFKFIGICEDEAVYICAHCGRQLYIPVKHKRKFSFKGFQK
jgi:hypothetical protein